ncbi:MAG: hypothetical protein KKC46_22880 [Proteobacteria bacterium]|nr:hypothetical protein [Pseudomonadota bacterium]
MPDILPDKAKEIQISGNTFAVPEPVYEVYDTDVLILGGGFAAISAAMETFAQGTDSMIADKDPFGFSGG